MQNKKCKSIFIPIFRKQYTVYLNTVKQGCELLKYIGKKLKININAYDIYSKCKGHTVLKFIIGAPSLESIADEEAIKKILKCYNSIEKYVIRVAVDTFEAIPGTFAKIVCVANEYATFYYSYLTEDGDIIIDTSNNELIKIKLEEVSSV